jgi:hypothetical protein
MKGCENMTENKNRPQLYGLVKIGTKAENKQVGRISLWRQANPPDRNRPPFTGNVEIEGKKYYVAVWQNGDVPQ